MVFPLDSVIPTAGKLAPPDDDKVRAEQELLIPATRSVESVCRFGYLLTTRPGTEWLRLLCVLALNTPIHAARKFTPCVDYNIRAKPAQFAMPAILRGIELVDCFARHHVVIVEGRRHQRFPDRFYLLEEARLLGR